ncbi:mitochondrial 2-enoyl thioester reductase [Linderina macrospora]|uniref:Mitochondrial 2-enoyl thioester reductase n=1 Tax=Linderina macrospora TaxID=4868 RepID=A0ACC1JGI0_9FUNG|nr:mitochondrial 2-enoyl thioester reductase [Linderina macrospora]
MTHIAAVYTETGDPVSVLRVVERQLPSSLQDGQLLIRMLAAPVNPSDLNQVEGVYPVKGRFGNIQVSGGTTIDAAVGGNEGVGEVIAVGSGVSGDLSVGDWVVPERAGEFGTWATHAVVDRTAVVKIPEDWRAGLEPLQVASIKVNPSTAYRMLRDFAPLNPGDYVIQNGANSGVGRAVIQLAKQLHVRTINVIRDRDNFDELASELHELGGDIIIKDKELTDDAVKRRLKSLDAPVRLGFNCVGGRVTLAMTKFISQGGSLVSYGGMSRQPVTLPTSLLLFKDIRAYGFWMNRWYETNKGSEARQEMWADILRLAREGKFVTQPMQRAGWPAAGVDAAQEAVSGAVAWGAKHAFIF